MIPKYESAENRIIQIQIGNSIAPKFKSQYRDDPTPFEGIDGELIRDNSAFRLLEIKERKGKFGNDYKDRYPTLKISVSKIKNGQQTSRERGIPFWLVIKWDDALVIRHIPNDAVWPIVMWGRDDRPWDPNAKEPAYEIPNETFTIIEQETISHWSTRI